MYNLWSADSFVQRNMVADRLAIWDPRKQSRTTEMRSLSSSHTLRNHSIISRKMSFAQRWLLYWTSAIIRS
jgi:hypothetical protein